jgi:hypothetical protein
MFQQEVNIAMLQTTLDKIWPNNSVPSPLPVPPHPFAEDNVTAMTDRHHHHDPLPPFFLLTPFAMSAWPSFVFQ